MGAVPPGSEISRERTARHVPRHHHVRPYAAIVLRGGYVEAGDRGRFRAEAGDVLLHDGFESHQDHFSAGGADILNLPLSGPPAASLGRVGDPDDIARAAERSVADAIERLLESFVPIAARGDDWPDLLAAELRADRVVSLGAWANSMGLAPSSVSRGFRLAYGVSPQRFRAECRASAAARALRRTRLSLAMIAAESGFSDQPHLTRAIGRLFGRSPARLRDDVKSVQDWAAAKS
jgi:AraC-like DNA-binding protein